MPAAPRWNKKAKKIAYALIGPPENMLDDATPKDRKIKKELLIEDGQWAK